MWHTYHSVSSVDEAVALLHEYQGRARVVAGGTDIIIELEQGKRAGVDVLIDITRVPHLDDIVLDGNMIRMGALVTHNHVVGSDLMLKHGLPLAQASWEVGAPQIRNRATVAGNLITASPANDTIVPLMVLGAQVTLASKQGQRTVPLAKFYTGLRQTVMRPDELLTHISFPALQEHERGVFLKLGLRRAQAISVVNTAVLLSLQGDKVIYAAIALGSVAPTIIRVPEAEKALTGQTLTPETIAHVARIAASVPTPIDDVRSTAEYRSEMVKVLVARALRILATGEQTPVFANHPAMLWGPHQAHVPDDALPQASKHETANQTPIETTINGQSYTIHTGHDKTLLRWLREDAKLTGTKEGCAEGECGACTVFLDDVAVMACMVPAPRAHHSNIVTVEGLQQDDTLHPIQAAFVQEGAVQCGYCTPGFLMAGAKLLEEYANPTQEQIEQSISGNLCRCTGYYKIIEAFKQASQIHHQENHQHKETE